MEFMKRNLTVQLDETTIKQARIVAARRSTSLSRLLVTEIERAVSEDMVYQRALVAALNRLDKPSHLGGGTLPARDALHER
jgi:hypothetical protein